MKNFKFKPLNSLGILFHFVFCVCTFSSTVARTSFLTVLESGELINEGYYRIGVAPQLRLTDGGGFNFGAFVDGNLSEGLNWRALVGGGKTDFYGQGSVKWIPIPDFQKQPAIGGRLALFYARDEDQSFSGLQVAPLLSKNVSTIYGSMNPYVSLPISFVFNSKKNVTALSLAIGSELNLDLNRQVGLEFNLNLNESVSSLTAFFNFPFDNSIGYKK